MQDPGFQFIEVGPDIGQGRESRRQVRSHAAKRALQKRREAQQGIGQNFVVSLGGDCGPSDGGAANNEHTGRSLPLRSLIPSLFSLEADDVEKFGTEVTRLDDLLGYYGARQAAEPVFTVADPIAFQTFKSVFRAGLGEDPALLNSAMLTFTFAVKASSTDHEIMDYKSRAITSIRERLQTVDGAVTESTLGAILLIVGVEARMGRRSQVELHMDGLRQLLEICRTSQVPLTDGIKRAIFWQDLNSSVLTGSKRIVDHTTFAEMQWRRDDFVQTYSVMPGFQKISHLLSTDLLTLLEDIHALQSIRDSPKYDCADIVGLLQFDNQLASVLSRLVSLPAITPLLDLLYQAVYLSTCMLCCRVWRLSVVPSHISTSLLDAARQKSKDPVWDDHPELLLWLLFVCGTFAPTEEMQSQYRAVLRQNHSKRFGGLYNSWPELQDILKQFIWSERSFETQANAFWAAYQADTGSGVSYLDQA